MLPDYYYQSTTARVVLQIILSLRPDGPLKYFGRAKTLRVLTDSTSGYDTAHTAHTASMSLFDTAHTASILEVFRILYLYTA